MEKGEGTMTRGTTYRELEDLGIARHAIACGPCRVRVRRIMIARTLNERVELMCQIDLHATNQQRRDN